MLNFKGLELASEFSHQQNKLEQGKMPFRPGCG
jgi:hypothetical protein